MVRSDFCPVTCWKSGMKNPSETIWNKYQRILKKSMSTVPIIFSPNMAKWINKISMTFTWTVLKCFVNCMASSKNMGGQLRDEKQRQKSCSADFRLQIRRSCYISTDLHESCISLLTTSKHSEKKTNEMCTEIPTSDTWRQFTVTYSVCSPYGLAIKISRIKVHLEQKRFTLLHVVFFDKTSLLDYTS